MAVRFRLFVLLLVAVLAAGVSPVWADDAPDPQDQGELTAEEADTDEEDTIGRGALRTATLLARHFGLFEGEEDLAPAEAAELFDLGLGFGAIFKLQLYATVTGADVGELVAAACAPEGGECEFNWGELRRELGPEALAELDSYPKNLGQLISAGKRGHGRPEHAASHGRGRHAPIEADSDDASGA